uniref:DnaJ heat shock protein family (Hsp40) member B14 n=1 Tax=Monodelphis domestica TaxID=13616 RepID=F7CB93_MONDO
MEGNRDKVEKCIKIARESLEAGNRNRALRFLHKAEKLYPSPRAQVLLEAIMKNGSTVANGPHCQKPSSGGDHNRPNNTKDSAGGESGKAYTKDQVYGKHFVYIEVIDFIF